ncbi:Opioid growth factor receptor like 1 [Balamuthia mandrillaris]
MEEERNDNNNEKKTTTTTEEQQRNKQDASGESGAQVFTASAPAIRTRVVVVEPTTATTKGSEGGTPSASLDDASVILPPKKNPPLQLEPRGAALRRIERAKLYARLSSEGSAMDKLSPSRALQHVRQQEEGEEEVGGGEEGGGGGGGETSTPEEVIKEPKDKEKETDEEAETEEQTQEEEAEEKGESKEKRKSVPPPPPRYPWEASSKEKAFPLRSQLSFNFGHYAAIIPQLTKQQQKHQQQEPQQHQQESSQPMPKHYPFPKPTHGYKNTGTLIVTRSARKKAKKEQQSLTTQRNELLAAIRGFKKTRLNQLQNAAPPRSSPSKPTRRKKGSQTTVLPPPPPVLPGVDMISAISLATREEMLAAIRGFQKTKLNKTGSNSELEDEQHKEKEREEERKTDERASPQRTFVDPVLERVHRRTFSYERVSMKAESEEDDGTMFSVKKTTAQNEQRVRTWVGSKKSFEEESSSEDEDEDSSDSLTTSDEEEKEEELTKTTPRGIQQNNTKGKEIEEMEEDQLPPSKWKLRLARRASMLDDQNSSPATKHRNVMSWRISLQSHKLKEERKLRRHEQRRNRERKEAKRVLPDAKYVCRRCGRLLFEGEAVVDIKSIWQLEDFEADCFVVKRIHNLHELRRYDVHLHQGWYCCGFIAMRMTVDKYGTGRHFLVYCDDVLKDFQYAQVSLSSLSPSLLLSLPQPQPYYTAVTFSIKETQESICANKFGTGKL